MAIDTYTASDFTPGDRVKAFHPATMGVMHWATVRSVGRGWLHVTWNVTGARGKVRFADVSEIDHDGR